MNQIDSDTINALQQMARPAAPSPTREALVTAWVTEHGTQLLEMFDTMETDTDQQQRAAWRRLSLHFGFKSTAPIAHRLRLARSRSSALSRYQGPPERMEAERRVRWEEYAKHPEWHLQAVVDRDPTRHPNPTSDDREAWQVSQVHSDEARAAVASLWAAYRRWRATCCPISSVDLPESPAKCAPSVPKILDK